MEVKIQLASMCKIFPISHLWHWIFFLQHENTNPNLDQSFLKQKHCRWGCLIFRICTVLRPCAKNHCLVSWTNTKDSINPPHDWCDILGWRTITNNFYFYFILYTIQMEALLQQLMDQITTFSGHQQDKNSKHFSIKLSFPFDVLFDKFMHEWQRFITFLFFHFSLWWWFLTVYFASSHIGLTN